jgi:glucuronokinase
MTVRTQAFARAGLLGNPSDGYFGKIIAISVKNFSAEVWLEESEELRILPGKQDEDIFSGISGLVERTRLFGYYGGARLIKAALVKFDEYCRQQGIGLSGRNCTIRYESSIPRQLGLGGSSAIITAVMRALMDYYGVEIQEKILPTLILDAELKELGINAGYMDRVIQVYEGCLYMDLDARLIEKDGHGLYERLDPGLLPPLYLAYKRELGKVSGAVLDSIRAGYEKKDPSVLATLERLAELAHLGKSALVRRDLERLFELMNENFDLRSKIMAISSSNRELISTARRCGASAKFAGSGGSIIGMYRHEEDFEALKNELGRLGAEVFRPRIV